MEKQWNNGEFVRNRSRENEIDYYILIGKIPSVSNKCKSAHRVSSHS